MPRHFTNVQGLRGIACLLVVLAHVWNMERQYGVQTPVLREIQWFGFAGVDLFFVISGFIITATNRAQFGAAMNVPAFVFRRAWRIYPMFWVAMAASLPGFLFCAGTRLLESFSASFKWLLLMPGLPANPLVPQAWTLTYELMFYFAFAAFLYMPGRWAARGMTAWTLLIAPAMFFGAPTNPFAALALSPFVLEFLAGCLIAWLSSRGVRGGGAAAIGAGIVYASAAVLVAHERIMEPWPDAIANNQLRVAVFGPAAALIVYGFVSLEGRLKMPRGLLAIGDASYSLYLLHGIVLLGAFMLGFHVSHTPGMHVLWLAGSFAASIAAGMLAHRFIERPLLKMWKPRVAKREPEPARMAA